jgi:hypothetical protein
VSLRLEQIYFFKLYKDERGRSIDKKEADDIMQENKSGGGKMEGENISQPKNSA